MSLKQINEEEADIKFHFSDIEKIKKSTNNKLALKVTN
jgi:uncharacterized protein YaiL (DUF2058 family)